MGTKLHSPSLSPLWEKSQIIINKRANLEGNLYFAHSIAGMFLQERAWKNQSVTISSQNGWMHLVCGVISDHSRFAVRKTSEKHSYNIAK